MPIKLESNEVIRLVKEVNKYFQHYYQYDNFFENNGILFYTDCRVFTKRGGLEVEFSKFEDSILLKMLKALIVYIKEYEPESQYPTYNKALSIQLIEALVSMKFDDIQFNVPSNTTESLIIVCEEANELIYQQKYPLAIDRVHTFFQQYIRNKCKENDIEIEDDCSIKNALLAFIGKHMYFEDIMREEELRNIFKSLSNMCDRFDTFRNHHSLAHPSESLLQKNEAKLMINVVRSLYDYLESI